ncbi:nitrilase-related carbon-nitrogen hydrolase [Anaerotruncus colihominis]|uniref:CN hydrolase domain-containing protein n=1 Tax=Anaerotruncus colihominis TaxID=169435 RepID=A0A845SV34_9FIRM|nr:nitrilase-related carbon-nitrogen hydrolase [Anaerotruncus colihominis]MCR2026192.1 hypothetical protein [Anaerotruncus colihominis]NDO38330.1 hypothetical protein [Anaerotruncus colihominis]
MWEVLLPLISFWMSFRVTPKKIDALFSEKNGAAQNNAEFAAPEAVRAASVQLTARIYKDLRDYTDELYLLAKNAVDAGAQVVVYPEYAGVLALTMLPFSKQILNWVLRGRRFTGLDGAAPDPVRMETMLETFGGFLNELYQTVFSGIARTLRVYVVAGTTLVREEDGRLVNRCVVFGPDGKQAGVQDKTSVLRFDSDAGVSPSDILEPIDTPLGPLGVVIGSDAYYFERFKILAEKGARLIAVPDARGGIMPDLLRCRANESGVYVLYACYAAGPDEGPNVRAAIYAPFGATPTLNGVVAYASNAHACAVTARTNLQKLTGDLTDPSLTSRNEAFIKGDYLHSYRYCGNLPYDLV